MKRFIYSLGVCLLAGHVNAQFVNGTDFYVGEGAVVSFNTDVINEGKITNNGKVHFQKNLENLKSAPKLNREFCKINCDENKIAILNKIRGLSPYPCAWIETNWGEMKIYDAEISNTTDKFIEDSNVFVANKKMYLNCSDGVIEIKSLQIQGKSRMDAKSFINGLK